MGFVMVDGGGSLNGGILVGLGIGRDSMVVLMDSWQLV